MKQKLNRNIVAFLGNVSAGSMQVYGDMLVLPLVGGNPWEASEIISLDEAFARQCVEFREVNESGRVPELLAVNRCHRKVLILAGQELTGAKQNRTLNTNILLPENSETVIPVSCTEQGRWGYTKENFDLTDKLISHRIRRNIEKSVHASLMFKNQFRADQSRVWHDIEDYMQDFKRENRTRSYHRMFRDLESEVEKYTGHFPLLENQTGIAVFIDGILEGTDIIAHRKIYAENHLKILKSYIVDVLRMQMNKKHGASNDFKIEIDYRAKQDEARRVLEKFLDEAARSHEFVSKSPGLGYEHRLTGGQVEGNFLVVDEKPLTGHLFPRQNEERKDSRMPFTRDFF